MELGGTAIVLAVDHRCGSTSCSSMAYLHPGESWSHLRCTYLVDYQNNSEHRAEEYRHLGSMACLGQWESVAVLSNLNSTLMVVEAHQ